ncbi:hypothetical protein [Prevotella multiformis]|uniref:hypothetical protein n=1 Tax=Prevotella multiformis TaxID=282402 RepID=UPI003FA14BDA
MRRAVNGQGESVGTPPSGRRLPHLPVIGFPARHDGRKASAIPPPADVRLSATCRAGSRHTGYRP